MTYKVELIHSEEGYSAGCPELPGCRSEGQTEEEAIANIKSAISDYLSVIKEMKPEEEIEKKFVFVEVPEPASSEDATHRPKLKPFKVIPLSMGLPPGGSYDKIEDLLDLIEGPYRH